MSEPTVTVIAKLRTKEGAQSRVLEGLLALVKPTRAEAGCIQYEVHQSATDATEIVLYETWRSQADLDQHQAMPYLRGFMAEAPGLLAAPVEVSFLSKKT